MYNFWYFKKFESFLVFPIFKFIYPFKAYDVFQEDDNDTQSCNCDTKSESGYFSSQSSSSSVSSSSIPITNKIVLFKKLKFSRFYLLF